MDIDERKKALRFQFEQVVDPLGSSSHPMRIL